MIKVQKVKKKLSSELIILCTIQLKYEHELLINEFIERRYDFILCLSVNIHTQKSIIYLHR